MVKRKIDDLCRWVYGPKECQIHVVSETIAAFVTLRRDARPSKPLCRQMKIEAGSEDQVAAQIIGYFER